MNNNQAINYLFSILDIKNTEKPDYNAIIENWDSLSSLAKFLKIGPWLSYISSLTFKYNINEKIYSTVAYEFELNKKRTAFILSQLKQIAYIHERENIPLIFIKGASSLIKGIYPFGCRFMSDIDILTNPENAERSKELLLNLGYREDAKSIPQIHHLPIMIRNSFDVPVEIHTEPYPALSGNNFSFNEILGFAEKGSIFGTTALVPSDTDHAWIMMRTDPLSRPHLPRIKDIIEMSYLFESGRKVSTDILFERAMNENLDRLIDGILKSYELFSGKPPDTFPGQKRFYDWLKWSAYCIRKETKNKPFCSARNRFTGLLFYTNGNISSKLSFLSWMSGMIVLTDRFEPGNYKKPSLAVKSYRIAKLFLGIVLIFFEYLTFKIK